MTDNAGEPLMLTLEGVGDVYGTLFQWRVNKELLESKGLRCYDIRHADDDAGVPATLEPFVRINFFGTFATTQDIQFLDKYINIVDWDFTDEHHEQIIKYLKELDDEL